MSVQEKARTIIESSTGGSASVPIPLFGGEECPILFLSYANNTEGVIEAVSGFCKFGPDQLMQWSRHLINLYLYVEKYMLKVGGKSYFVKYEHTKNDPHENIVVQLAKAGELNALFHFYEDEGVRYLIMELYPSFNPESGICLNFENGETLVDVSMGGNQSGGRIAHETLGRMIVNALEFPEYNTYENEN